MSEIWKSIPGYPDYEASDLGNVRRSTPGKGTWVGRILNPTLTKDPGYAVVNIYGKVTLVHVLVCSAFNGTRPSLKHEVAHWDGNKINNREDNLRWATHADQYSDKVRHGRNVGTKGKSHNSVLNEMQVREIRDLIGKKTIREIGFIYGISHVSVLGIKSGKHWGWVA